MISLPISVLTTNEENFISQSTIQEHQKFCKALLKSYHSFKNKKIGVQGKTKTKFKFEENFFSENKKFSQEDVFKWFGNLNEEERIKICTIKNKWLVNILIQIYLLSVTYDDISLKPLDEIEDLFNDNKNFEHIEDNSYNKNTLNKKNENIYEINNDDINKDLSLYENFFSIDYPKGVNILNKKEDEKNKIQKQFIDHIRVISLDENEHLDTLILGKDLIIDIDKLKYYLNYFSKDKCFQDWLLPIQLKENIYNFILPSWMHGINNLTIFEIISGYIEQHILLNYEYFYYSKKIYEYSYNNQIVNLYNENKELVSFVYENYSTFGNSDKAKKEFISRIEIREIVKFVKNDEIYKKKINYMENIYDLTFQEQIGTKRKNILNREIDQDIYQNLNIEMIQFGIDKVIEHLTFSTFLDILNCRNIIFQVMRKKISDNRNDKILKELLQDDFLSSKINKDKKKNKKKKKKNKNNGNNEEIKKEEIIWDINKAIKELENIVVTEEEIKEFFKEENESDLNKEINIISNKDKINDNIDTKLYKNDISEFSDDKNDEKEENKNIKRIHEEDNCSSNRNKNKGMFLYPTNTTKKKKKKNKKPCSSAKKIIGDKNNNNNDIKNYEGEKTHDKNASSNITIKSEKSNNILINTSSSLTKDKNENESKNINIDNKNASFNGIDNLNNIKLPSKSTNDSLNKNMNKESNKNNNLFYNNNKVNNNFMNYINIPINSNIYASYTPSEKFFESLTSEIKNYNTVTLNNLSNLNPLRKKYLNFIEVLIKSELDSKYEIKYGHYGSYFTNLSIEGSDIDILIYYKNKSSENSQDFLKDILFMLNKHEDKFESIQPILTASVPVIKLQISIKNEIKDLKFETTGYSEGYLEFDKINFDLTFTQNEQEYLHSQQVVEYINKSLNTYPMITQMLLLLKRYFKIMKMNKSFHGGLSSYSLYLLIASFCKKFPTIIFSKGKALFSFLGFFSFFEFDKLGIDIENPDIFYSLNNNINNNYNSYNDDNIQIKEINIIDPLTKLNVAKSSFKVDEIQITFRTAYDFLRTEGCYYDYAVFVYKTGYDNDFFKQIKNNFDIFGNNDFKIIKKMFTLNKMSFFCDFFAN